MDQINPDESPLHELVQLRQQYAELKAVHEKNIAVQKQTDEALQQSEHKFFALFEKSAFPASLSKLTDGTIVEVNEAFENEFGLIKQQVIGKTSFELGINPDEEGRTRILEALKKNGSVHHQKMVLRSKSGEKNYYETNIDKVVINGEEFLLNTTQNISEYKSAENKLKENFDLIRIAGEKVKLGGWNVILNENRAYLSDEVATILEIPTDYGSLMEDGIQFYAPEWRDKIKEVFGQCAHQGIPFDEELEMITATGKRLWVRTIGEAVRNESGNIVKVQGAFQDITERKKADTKLIKAKNMVEKSEIRYRTVASNSPVVTFVLNPDGIFTLSEGKGLEKLGLKPGQVVGLSALELYKDFPVIINDIKKALAGNVSRSETVLPGVVFDILYNPVFDNKGNLIEVIGVSNDITERKQADIEIKKHKSELEEYFENDISADYVVSVSGEIFSCNKTFLSLFGFEKKSETKKFDITGLYKNQEDMKQIVRLIKKQGKIENFEVEFISKEGKTIHSLINAIGIFDKDNKLEKIRGYVVDITKQKNIEKELLKLSRTVEQSPASVIVTDLDGNIEYVNPKTLEITGYTNEELIGKNPRLFNSGEKQKKDYQQLWSTILSGKEWYGEFHNKKKNGELYWEFASISPIFNDKQEIINYVAIKEDITERIRFEDTRKLLLEISQLTTKHITLTSFLAAVHQKIKQIIRADNFYVALNNEMDNTFSFPYHVDEYDKVELHKAYDFSNGYTDYVLKTNQSLIITPENKLEVDQDEIIKGYGDELSVWLGVPFKTKEGGQPNGVIAIQDYKNRKSYTETDKTIMEIIAHNIGSFIERIKYLEELVYAKEKAEESDRLKSAFLSNMSHEIRTPMNGILGFTELLLEPDLSSEEKEDFIKIVQQSGQRMLNTVNDIVEISKIEAGLVNVSVKETDINKRLEELFRFFQPEAEKKGLILSLTTLLPEALKNTTTDQNKLDSILTNLIKNAIKYTDEGTIEFGCKTVPSVHEPMVRFYVKDSGIGIPADRQEAIFNRFIQADITDTRVFEGSGLGLAISKSYVEMLGGSIWLESKEGLGSTFYFTLPLSKYAKEKTIVLNDIPVDNEKNKGFAAMRSLKIMIAEDDDTSRNYISLIINDFNAKILEASTGIETVELCRNTKDLDLILMDIQMPIMNGYDATREIRKFNKKVIIIAQTAFALSGDREKAIEAGCDDYIAKPISKVELHSLIHQYLRK